jgi:hypothetical protein
MTTIQKLCMAVVGAAFFSVTATPVSAITMSIGGTAVVGQGQFSSVPGAITIDFESGAPTTGSVVYSVPGANPTVVSGDLVGAYGAPESDTTRYLAVSPLGDWRGTNNVWIKFENPVDYFGLYWGSVDSYNYISFYKDGNLLASFNSPSLPHMNVYANFFADEGKSFDAVQLYSNGVTFESDNHAYRMAAIPPINPTTVPEYSSGLGLVFGTFFAMSLLKRKQQQKALD